MTEKVRLFGADWCGDCIRAKRFLEEMEVPYEWFDIDADPEAAEFVLRANGGVQTVPTVVLPDGSLLAEPSNEELAVRLDLGGPGDGTRGRDDA